MASAEKMVSFGEKPIPPKEPDPADLEEKLKYTDKLVLENLQFDLGKFELLPGSKEELDKVAKMLEHNPNMKILLEGHTDRIGNPRRNLKLSEDRVRSAKQYIVSKGIGGERIKTKGWGDTKPLTDSMEEEIRKKNRRVEITILER